MLIPTIDLLTYGGASRGSEPHTIVVTDVKGELLELTGDELARRGYEVLLFDAARPARGQRFNPLKQVLDLYSAGMPNEAEQAADGVAESLVPDDRDGAASHWVTSARSLLSAVILLVCLDGSCPDGARTMGTVAAVACRGTEGEGDGPCAPLRSLLRSLPASHPARPRASQFLSSGGNELRSIVSTLKAAIRAYGSAPMAWLTSGSEVDPRRVLSRKTALFVRTVDEGSPYNALATVLLGQLWEAARLSAEAEAEGGRLARPVTVVGDEWGNLPRVPCLPAVLSLGRSYGFYWVGAVQNLAQLNRYGERDGRPKVLANCGVKVALKLGEEEDRRYFTELVGKTTRHTRGTSSGRAGSGTSATTSYSEHADDVVHAWEWTSMAPDRDGAVVVRQAENGAPRSHAGGIRAPLADCASTPTRGHFGLGDREHEAARRRAYRERLEARAALAGRAPAAGRGPGTASARTRGRGVTAVKQVSVCSRQHLERMRGYLDWGRDKALAHETWNVIDERDWWREMDETREALGHNRPGRAGARCTYMQHQVLAFNPDECSCNGGPMTPGRCMDYARDYVALRYPDQEVVAVLHLEECRADGSRRFACHLGVNRSDLATGLRLDEGPARRAAACARARTAWPSWSAGSPATASACAAGPAAACSTSSARGPSAGRAECPAPAWASPGTAGPASW